MDTTSKNEALDIYMVLSATPMRTDLVAEKAGVALDLTRHLLGKLELAGVVLEHGTGWVTGNASRALLQAVTRRENANTKLLAAQAAWADASRAGADEVRLTSLAQDVEYFTGRVHEANADVTHIQGVLAAEAVAR